MDTFILTKNYKFGWEKHKQRCPDMSDGELKKNYQYIYFK